MQVCQDLQADRVLSASIPLALTSMLQLRKMNKQLPTPSFVKALANLQYVLIARRVLASDEPMRLNWKHFTIMAFVKDNGKVLPSEISDKLELSRSSTSKYLKCLKEKGLVATLASKSDGRSYTVQLTPVASSILENIYRGERENAQLALSTLTPQEAEQFIRIAAKITVALDNDNLKTI